MFVRYKCSCCGEQNVINVSVEVIEERRERKTHYKVNDMAITTKSCNLNEFSRDIFHELKHYVYDGITTLQLCNILREDFNVSSDLCCGIIEELMINLYMYSPDREHLYYVDEVNAL